MPRFSVLLLFILQPFFCILLCACVGVSVCACTCMQNPTVKAGRLLNYSPFHSETCSIPPNLVFTDSAGLSGHTACFCVPSVGDRVTHCCTGICFLFFVFFFCALRTGLRSSCIYSKYLYQPSHLHRPKLSQNF